MKLLAYLIKQTLSEFGRFGLNGLENNSTLEIASLKIDPAFVEVGVIWQNYIFPFSSINSHVFFLIGCFLVLHVILLINLYLMSFPLGLTFLFLILFCDDKNPCIFFFHLLLSLFEKHLSSG